MSFSITGDKNIDKYLKLGLFIGAGYIGYKIYKNAGRWLSAPINPDQIPVLPGCVIPEWEKKSIKKSMDTISQLLTGYNIYNYPNEVNVLLGYDKCRLEFANDYFKQTYGTTLYKLIYNEWDLDGDYDAAENKLKINGLGY